MCGLSFSLLLDSKTTQKQEINAPQSVYPGYEFLDLPKPGLDDVQPSLPIPNRTWVTKKALTFQKGVIDQIALEVKEKGIQGALVL